MVFYYKIILKDLPKIRFACAASTDKYSNIIDHRPNQIEIFVIDGVPVEMETDTNGIHSSIQIPPKSICVCMPDTKYIMRAAVPGVVHLNTVAVAFDSCEFYRFSDKDIDKNVLKEKNCLFLPQLCNTGDMYMKIVSIMKMIAGDYMRNDVISYARCTAR